MTEAGDTAPARPVPATIAVVIRGDDVLLVRRANPPDAGKWGFPGGKIDLGETISQAAQRELVEETGIQASAGPVITALDVVDRDQNGRLRFHYVLIAVLCHWTAGEPVAGDDASEARWVSLADLETGVLPLSLDVAEVAQMAAAMTCAPQA